MNRRGLIIFISLLLAGCWKGGESVVYIKFRQTAQEYIPVYVDSITVTITGENITVPLKVSIPSGSSGVKVSLPEGFKRLVAEARGLKEDKVVWRGERTYTVLPQVPQSVSIYMSPLQISGFVNDPPDDLLYPMDAGYDLNGVYVKKITSPESALLFRIWTMAFGGGSSFMVLLDLDQNSDTRLPFSPEINSLLPAGFGADAGILIENCEVRLFYDWSGNAPVFYPSTLSSTVNCDEASKLIEFEVPLSMLFEDDGNINFIVYSLLFYNYSVHPIVVDIAPDDGYGTLGSGMTSPINPFERYAEGTIEVVAGSTWGDGGEAWGTPLGDEVNDVYFDGTSLFLGVSISGGGGYQGAVRKVNVTDGKIYNVAGTVTLDSAHYADAEFPIPVSIGKVGGIWVSSSGSIYVSDEYGCVIYKIEPSQGIYSIVAGIPEVCGYNGDGSGVELGSLSSLFFDENAGEVYFSDTSNNIIRKVKQDGTVITVAGDYYTGGNCNSQIEAIYTGPATGACLNAPRGIYPKVGANGILEGFYIADTGNYIVRYVDLTVYPPTITRVVGTGTSGVPYQLPIPPDSADLFSPYYLFYNGNYLFILDTYLFAIFALNMSDGLLYDTGIIINGYFGGIHGDASTIYYVNFPFIIKGDISSGFPVTTTYPVAGSKFYNHGGDGGDARFAALDFPVGLTIYGRTLYFGEEFMGSLYRVNLDTNIMERLAGNGSANYSCASVPLNGATDVPVFAYIKDICVDVDGNVYVAEDGTCVVRKLDFTVNSIEVVAGNCACRSPEYGVTALSTSLMSPTALAVADDRTIYIAQYDGGTYFSFVDEISPDGVVRRFAGAINGVIPSFSFSVTSGALQLLYVSSVKFSPDQNELYVVDSGAGYVYAVERNTHSVRIAYSTIGDSIYDVFPWKDNFSFLVLPYENGVYGLAESGSSLYRIAGSPFGIDGFRGLGKSARDALIFLPQEISGDSRGNLYFILRGLHGIGGRIMRIVPR